jgi:hypothetical protein
MHLLERMKTGVLQHNACHGGVDEAGEIAQDLKLLRMQAGTRQSGNLTASGFAGVMNHSVN